jgi:hypothetical protein
MKFRLYSLLLISAIGAASATWQMHRIDDFREHPPESRRVIGSLQQISASDSRYGAKFEAIAESAAVLLSCPTPGFGSYDGCASLSPTPIGKRAKISWVTTPAGMIDGVANSPVEVTVDGAIVYQMDVGSIAERLRDGVILQSEILTSILVMMFFVTFLQIRCIDMKTKWLR